MADDFTVRLRCYEQALLIVIAQADLAA